MRKKLFLTVLLILPSIFSISIKAQDFGETKTMSSKEQAKTIRNNAKDLAKEFKLKGAQKDSFLVLYTQYRQEMYLYQSVLQKALVSLHQKPNDKNKKEITKMSDSNAEKIIMASIQSKEEMAKAQFKYYNTFKQILKPSQIIKIFFNNTKKSQDTNSFRNNRMRGTGGFPMGGGMHMIHP